MQLFAQNPIKTIRDDILSQAQELQELILVEDINNLPLIEFCQRVIFAE